MSTNWDLDTPEGMHNAVQWQSTLIEGIRDGGAWIVPRSGSIYTVHHKTKTVTVHAWCEDGPVDRVFREMGWTVQRMFNA